VELNPVDPPPVAIDDVQNVQQLPLVLVHPLHLHVEQRARIDDDAGQLLRQMRQRQLVAALHRMQPVQ